MQAGKEVYVVAYNRTPFLKSRWVPGPFAASDMAVAAGRELLLAQSLDPAVIDEVILGCMMPSENEANIARLVALRLGCGDAVPGYTVQRNCASGMQALDSAYKDIQLGRTDLVLAGGTETMSRAPLLFSHAAARWFSKLNMSKTIGAKLKAISQFRPGLFKPTIALLKGLTDPYCGLTMPQTAEQLAYEFNITRADMDEFACRSQQRASAAQESGYFSEIVDIYGKNKKFYSADDGIRGDTTVAKLGSLRPIIDKRFGVVTAGNSSQVTDGSSVLMLASEEGLKKHNLTPVGRISDVQWAGLRPEAMGLGPVFATIPMLQRQGLGLNDIDAWEINEAFAAQVIACLRAFNSKEFCAKHFAMNAAFGEINQDDLNVDGGAIALGHPVGASGARIVARLLSVLHRRQQKVGVAAICIGGGQGGAMLVEAL